MKKRKAATPKRFEYADLSSLAQDRVQVLTKRLRTEEEKITHNKGRAREYLVRNGAQGGWLEYSRQAASASVEAARFFREKEGIYKRGSLGIKRK